MSWQEEYRRKLMAVRDAVRCVESGMRVHIHPGCAEPEALVEALMERAPYLRDVEIIHIMTFGAAPMVAINLALQVDLTGQVCSDSIGQYIYSGFGGQSGFSDRGLSRERRQDRASEVFYKFCERTRWLQREPAVAFASSMR
jgi:acyl-CoA hydrolase